MTDYEIVFTVFLNKILDDRYANMPTDMAESDLTALLNAAVFRFQYPKISLTRDDTTMKFVEVLGEDEIQIIASLMVVEWFKRVSRDIGNYTMDMTTSEFKTFSKANQLVGLNKTEEIIKSESMDMLRIYHMRNGQSSGFAKLGGE
jgi:hypothetical protein